MTLGFIVGKFYPPHRGHKHLIATARGQCDRLVVMIAHHPTQRISGELRKAWLEEIHPDCEIHLVPDTLADDSAAWAKFTIEHLGRAPDMVFTSEAYGDPYARHMQCRHVLVDLERSAVPISATRIRDRPLDHLDFLEPCVRAHYVRRVVLIGAESTGKTTLARALAGRYGTGWVPEYGREHWEKKVAGLPMEGPLPGFADEEFVHIATEQQRRENAAARAANRILFCDTNAWATGLWCERYQGHRHPPVDAIGAADRVDMYLLAHPDFPFVQDGFRDGEAIREWMHARFAEEAGRSGVPLLHVRGDERTRVAQIATALAGTFNVETPAA